MKILIDTRLLRKGNTSGVEEYTKLLIENILAIDQKNSYEFFSRFFLPNKILDISAKFFNYPKIDKFFKPDLVFSPHFNNIPLENTPRVLTIHDLSFVHHPDFFSNRHKFWHYLQDIEKQISKAKIILTDSDFTKSDLINTFHVSHEKIKRVYPGLNNKFKRIHPDEQILAKYKIKKPYLLYLGTLEPRKNVISLVEAFEILKTAKKFKDLNLVIAGGRGWLYKEILKKINSSQFKEDIILTGSVEEGDKVHIYNGAEVFIYPSFFEGFGFPPLEAQACGVPVVASTRTSLPETLGNSAVLVDPWRIGDLAHAIEEILINPNWKIYLVSAGFRNSKRFSWKKTAEEIISIFENFHL